MMRFIHYGHDHFDINQFDKPTNRFGIICKPWGGLWGSPIDSPNLSWHDWVIDNDFETDKYLNGDHFIFNIPNDANILYLRNIKEVLAMEAMDVATIRPFMDDYEVTSIDFEQLLDFGYDAILYENSSPQMYYALYGWDVDSVLVLNPKCLIMD